jgi:CO/xanthine dehydrogenase FAD-binding subunit
MAAATLEVADGRVREARIAVGSCSEVSQRLPGLEAALAGMAFDEKIAAVVTAEHLAPLRPIDDVRGSAIYRQDAAVTLLRRLLMGLAS